jgi:hypothetical protein
VSSTNQSDGKSLGELRRTVDIGRKGVRTDEDGEFLGDHVLERP